MHTYALLLVFFLVLFNFFFFFFFFGFFCFFFVFWFFSLFFFYVFLTFFFFFFFLLFLLFSCFFAFFLAFFLKNKNFFSGLYLLSTFCFAECCIKWSEDVFQHYMYFYILSVPNHNKNINYSSKFPKYNSLL
jgi:hypothetical protein